MKEIGNNAVELTDEQLAKVVGGDTPISPDLDFALSLDLGKCPNGYTACTAANCLNPKCGLLEQKNYVFTCGNRVAGIIDPTTIFGGAGND